MPSFTVNICVLTLVLLSFQHTCLGKPHSINKRGIVKDYFAPDPLVFATDKFEKGEDGKYYLKKSAYKSDSEVRYSAGENAVPEDLKADEVEAVSIESTNLDGSVKTETLKEEMTGTLVVEEAPPKPTPPVVEEVKVVEEVDISRAKSAAEEVTKNTEIEEEKAPFIPSDPKFVVPSKPDSKDEIPSKTDLPPLDVDEKVDEKISIGEVPLLYPRVIPVNNNFRLPILIPMRKVSYGTVSVIPVPPVDGSDRLPLPYEDEIMGEGPHESEVIEEVSQRRDEEKKRDSEFNPLLRMHLPFLSFRTFLKDLKEADKIDTEKESKVVDVLGKKFLMQSNVMKHPTGDNSRMYVRFMSVKPLEEVKPDVVKEEAEGAEQAKREDAVEEEIKKEIEVKEAEVLKEEEKLKESEVEKEAEILKAEETEIKMEVNREVPKEVALENTDQPGMEKVENPAVIDAEVKETKKFVIEDSVIASDEARSVSKSDEDLAMTEEKKENEKKKVELSENTDKNEKPVVPPNEDEIKSESTAVVKTEVTDKTMEDDNKKSFFLLEKNKKVKSKEESEEHKKSLKKSEKKKKKCKCEEKDSDSDDEEE